MLSSRLPKVEREAGPSRNRPAPQRYLAHLHSIRLFFPDRCSRSSTDRTEVCFIVHADEKLSAFVELEREVLTVTFYLASINAGDQ
jgi:hypothetical protein